MKDSTGLTKTIAAPGERCCCVLLVRIASYVCALGPCLQGAKAGAGGDKKAGGTGSRPTTPDPTRDASLDQEPVSLARDIQVRVAVLRAWCVKHACMALLLAARNVHGVLGTPAAASVLHVPCATRALCCTVCCAMCAQEVIDACKRETEAAARAYYQSLFPANTGGIRAQHAIYTQMPGKRTAQRAHIQGTHARTHTRTHTHTHTRSVLFMSYFVLCAHRERPSSQGCPARQSARQASLRIQRRRQGRARPLAWPRRPTASATHSLPQQTSTEH